MKLHHLLLCVHLLGVIVWVGGMSFAHLCLRPAALALAPAERLSLWQRVFARFFPIVWVAIAAIVGSGFAMLLEVGFAQAPRSWHAMAAIGLVMAADNVPESNRRFKLSINRNCGPFFSLAVSRSTIILYLQSKKLRTKRKRLKSRVGNQKVPHGSLLSERV